ncbi:MAG: hypothetical protein PUD14_08205 [Prevotellaceae bacterium]|nr:hypothetical protein [Prevotellaceae bacterium]
MAKIQIYEYPGRILWHERELDWYLKNDPDGINIAIANLCVELSKTHNEINKPEILLDEAYRVAIAIAATKNRDFYPIAKHFYYGYYKSPFRLIAVICGCVILSWQANSSIYENTIKETERWMKGKSRMELRDKIKAFLNKTPKKGLRTELIPNIGYLSNYSKKWILENVEDKKELEAIISFRSTIPMQISFLEKFVSYHYVKVHDARFTLTQSQMQTLIENVYQGKYLFVQKNTIAKPLADLTKNTEMEREVEEWKRKANEAEEALKRIAREAERLSNECALLKEKNEEWENMFASGFAGSCIVEQGSEEKAINSDVARENEAYRKEIEEKEALIEELADKLKNKSIPMHYIISGFKELADFGLEHVSSTYKSICTMLQDCDAWRNNREEIRKIFVEEKKKGVSPSVSYNYASGATHKDTHREIYLNNESTKLLE